MGKEIYDIIMHCSGSECGHSFPITKLDCIEEIEVLAMEVANHELGMSVYCEDDGTVSILLIDIDNFDENAQFEYYD